MTDLGPQDFELRYRGKVQPLRQVVYVRTGEPLSPAGPDPVRIPSAEGPITAAAQVPAEPSPFARVSGLQPAHVRRTIALVVDDLGLSFESTVYVRRALVKYIDTQIQPGDLVAIIRTSGGIGTLQQFTTDRRLLRAAADRVRWDFRSRHAVGAFVPVVPNELVGNPDDSGAGELRAAMASVASLGALEFVAQGVARLPGRKCIVFLSEGFPSLFADRGESGRIWRAMSRMLGRANAAGVVVYTMDARGLVSGGLTAEDDPQIRDVGFGGGGGGFSTTGGGAGPGDAGSGEGGAPPGAGSGGGAASGTTAPSGGTGRSGPPSGGASSYDAPVLVREKAGGRMRILLESQESMQFIARQTGGLAVANTNDLNLGLRRVLDDQTGYYLLGYELEDPAAAAGWEQGRIAVKVTRPGLRVRARAGVFGPAQPDATQSPTDPVLLAAMSPFTSGDITLRLTTLFGHHPDRGSHVRSLLFIDAAALRFTKNAAGHHEADADVYQLAVGDNGEILGDWRRALALRLTDDELAQVRAQGLVYTATLQIRKPGGYQIRTAIRDRATGRVGSASQFVEVPDVRPDRLAISSVLLQAKDNAVNAPTASDLRAAAVLGEPVLRVFEPGSDVLYAYEVYNPATKGAPTASLVSSVTLWRGRQAVHSSPQTALALADPSPKRRVVPAAGVMRLPTTLPAGPYVLQVTLRDATTGKRARSATQWVDFEVRARQTARAAY